MKTLSFPALNRRCAATALVVAGLVLCAYSAPDAKGTVKLEDARLDEFAVERAGMFDVSMPAKKLTLDAAKADPEAAARAGLWEVTGKGPAKKISLDDAKDDPLAAERAGLWNVTKARKSNEAVRK